MKICVVGAGAVGGHLAARLHAAGAAPSLLARGDTLAAIRSSGLVVRAPDAEIRAPLRVTDDARELGPQDVVVVAVKAPAVPDIAAIAGPLLAAETRVVFVLNGIPWWYDAGAAKTAEAGAPEAVFDRRCVVGSTFYSLCKVVEPGVVEVANSVSRLCLGDVAAGEPSPQTRALADLLQSDAMAVEVWDDIRDQVWEKLILLHATCPLSVLTSAPPADMLGEAACAAAGRQLVEEGLRVASALGRSVEIDADAVIEASRASGHRPSILQDLDNGRVMEVGALFDAPLALAREAGVDVPMLELMTSLVRIRARSAGLYDPAAAR